MSYRDWKFDEKGERYRWKYLETISYYTPIERNRIIWEFGNGYRNILYKNDNWNPNLLFKL